MPTDKHDLGSDVFVPTDKYGLEHQLEASIPGGTSNRGLGGTCVPMSCLGDKGSRYFTGVQFTGVVYCSSF